MMKLALSPAAAGLLRALLARAGVDRNRILLMSFESVDWQSLTFIGERHIMALRVPPGDADLVVARLADGLVDAEFHVPGQIVADIGVIGEPRRQSDGSIILSIEALTVAE